MHQSPLKISDNPSGTWLAQNTVKKCHFQAQLTDHTGSLIATIFGKNAEKFSNCTAEELIHIPNDQNILSIARLFTTSKFFIYLKARADEYSSESRTKHSVISLLESDAESSTSNTANDA
ncbi:hypothetical protein G4B88_018232 [Cannabis sativa]|uniref:Replication factor A C-terminal domain-containing protein n=1 Tax=Cannabis sativa TaxID=3483 RepID=A0A7J6FAA7_CANSA|nr:hypothetical protein G4B88_018232 [Cannabis sativa]